MPHVIWLSRNIAIGDSIHILVMGIEKVKKALAAYPDREIREKAGP